MKRLRRNYVMGVWLLTAPAVVVCGFLGLLLFVMVPLFMAAPLLVALVLTLPVIDDRPNYRPALVIGLFVAQVVAANVAIFATAGNPAGWRTSIALAAWFIGAILPFVIIAVVLLGARRDDKHAAMVTPVPTAGEEL